ncbi:MAG: PHP domain-containing protein, partial [Candidatus Hydrogenedentes bacterium]|nr:PHP domain-containing protein [Candidatus Hydrogenedentota bacterium]
MWFGRSAPVCQRCAGTSERSPAASQQYVDLHTHTCHSDGTYTPAEVIERAVALGFSAIAIADHDTLAGVPEAQAHADKLGIEYLPATEISARFGPAEIHILGYGVRLDNPELNEELKALCDSRANRAEQIVDKLNKLGVEVLLDKIHERANGGAIGRLHIAQEIHTKGYTRTVQQG